MLYLTVNAQREGEPWLGATLNRYIATLVCNPGTGQETTRDDAEIFAAHDDEAVRQAQEWLRRSGIAVSVRRRPQWSALAAEVSALRAASFPGGS
jgi:hypothetical protein